MMTHEQKRIASKYGNILIYHICWLKAFDQYLRVLLARLMLFYLTATVHRPHQRVVRVPLGAVHLTASQRLRARRPTRAPCQ
jgi:hypothetical protein